MKVQSCTQRGGQHLEGGVGHQLSGLGQVLVMGDNRGNSKDGRRFGFVDQSAVLGRAVSIYLRDGSLVWDRL